MPESDVAEPTPSSARRSSQDPMWRKVLRRPSLDPASVDHLVSKGYDKGNVKDALRKHDGDVAASEKKLAYLKHLRMHWSGRAEEGCEHCANDVRADRRPSMT